MDDQTPQVRPKRKYTRRQPLKPPLAEAQAQQTQMENALPPPIQVAIPNETAMPGIPPMPPMPPRPAVRPEMRAEDPREAALRRAEEIRGHGVQIAMDDGGHMFDVDMSTIPPGWRYQWMTYTVLGARDHDAETSLRLRGWTPVPASRHPELVPLGSPPADPVIKKGMMLMEIPEIIAAERDLDLKNAARRAVAQKEAQLASTPAGSLERTTDPRIHKINKTVGYEHPIPVPSA